MLLFAQSDAIVNASEMYYIVESIDELIAGGKPAGQMIYTHTHTRARSIE